MESGGKKQKEKSKDIVCELPHSIVANYRDVSLSEMANNGQRGLFLENMSTGNLQMVGQTEEMDDFDYVVAVVDKVTGKVDFRPADVYSLTMLTKDLLQPEQRRRSSLGRNEDFWTPENTAKQAKRSSLTVSFGDAKKLKDKEKAQTRTLEDSSMLDMNTSTLPTTPISTGVDEDRKIDTISALRKETISDVLPKPTMDAILPTAVYPVSLFFSEAELQSIEEIATQLMEQKLSDFLGSDDKTNTFPTMYTELLEGRVKDRRKCSLFCLCAAMAYIVKIGKNMKVINFGKNSPFSASILSIIETRYFASKRTYAKSRSSLSIARIEFERLLAHTVALALVLDPANRIYHIDWANYTGINAMKIEKFALALGAVKEPLPVGLRNTKGFAMVLKGPPQSMGNQRRRKRQGGKSL